MATSTTRKIKYAHVPKDGKDGRTPVYDPTAKKWTYAENPTAAQLSTSAQQMQAQEMTASEAKTAAQTAQSAAATAQSAAATAQQTADTKATAAEAVHEVKAQVFEAYDKDGARLTAENFQLQQNSDGWIMVFCARKPSAIAGGAAGPPFCLNLAYATKSDLKALRERVEALEKKLGITN